MKKELTWFTSAREKRLWLWAVAVLVAIFATLFVGNPLATLLRDQNVQAAFFLFGMLVIAAAVVVHGLRVKPSSIELSILLGILAVYVMFFLRLGIPERSHLIEYSVLAIFIQKAIGERKNQGKAFRYPALLTATIAISIGVLDEVIQFFLPHRVFDPQDIFFNVIAVIMAIGSSLLLTWLRKRIASAKSK